MNFVVFFLSKRFERNWNFLFDIFVSNEEFPLPKKIAKVQFLALLKNRRRI